MKMTNQDVIRLIDENANWWEQAASVFEQMFRPLAEVSAGNENLWRVQAAIYRERSQLCQSFLADLRKHDDGQARIPLHLRSLDYGTNIRPIRSRA